MKNNEKQNYIAKLKIKSSKLTEKVSPFFIFILAALKLIDKIFTCLSATSLEFRAKNLDAKNFKEYCFLYNFFSQLVIFLCLGKYVSSFIYCLAPNLAGECSNS